MGIILKIQYENSKVKTYETKSGFDFTIGTCVQSELNYREGNSETEFNILRYILFLSEENIDILNRFVTDNGYLWVTISEVKMGQVSHIVNPSVLMIEDFKVIESKIPMLTAEDSELIGDAIYEYSI